MNFIKQCQKNIKRMNFLDLACIKLAVAACMLLLLKFYPQLLALKWYWYLIITLIAMIKPFITLCA